MLTLSVSEVLRTTPRTRRIRLALHGQPFPYLAGQAVLVGFDGASPPRPYSIASTPAETSRDGLIELLVRVDEDGPGDLHADEVRAGQAVQVEGPFGRFTTPSVVPGQAVLVVAGGTGIAPLRPMMHELLAQPEPPPITLLYSVRAADEFAYLDELEEMAASGAIRLMPTVSRGDRAWPGRHGRIGEALLREVLPVSPEAVVGLVCGPPDFVRDVRAALLRLGVPDAQIRREQYDG